MGAIHSTKTGKRGSASKGRPIFSKLFRLDRTDPLSFGTKFPEISVEWIAPIVSFEMNFREKKMFKYVQMALPNKNLKIFFFFVMKYC